MFITPTPSTRAPRPYAALGAGRSPAPSARAGDDTSKNARILLSGLRLAYGIGVSMRLGEIARLELNYCVPARLQRGDRPVHGLQFGVGVTFL